MPLNPLHGLCLFGSVLVIGACATTPIPDQLESRLGATASDLQTVAYTPSRSDFRNPERGFYADSEYYQADPTPLDANELRALISSKAADGYQVSLLHRSYFLPEFINTPQLPASFVHTLQNDLQAVRRAGLKVILRFAYRTVALEDCQYLPPAEQPACEAKARAETDPPKAVILNHLENLRGSLTRNADVIAYVDAGLIGTYGEWAYATDQGTQSLLWGFAGALKPDLQYGYSDGNVPNANTQEVIRKYLEVLPETRAIAIRTPEQRVSLLQGRPDAGGIALKDDFDPRTWNPSRTTITDATAFDDSALARLGAHNDCFLASSDDFGTYYYAGYPGVDVAVQIAKEKEYLSANNLFVPMGGETCAVPENIPTGQFPAYARAELRKLRWSTLNTDYNQDVLTAMKGTLEEAKRQLGYRLVLVNSSLPKTASRNQVVSLQFTIRNDGYAPPFNPRKLEVVFLKSGSAPVRRAVTLSRAANTDPRYWKPATIKPNGALEPITYTVTARVSAPAQAGRYSLALNLPDPLLAGDARYSLRLANTGLWDAAQLDQSDPEAGFNRLGQSIQIQ